MNRRGFIGSILALGAAPAIVRAESLMRIASMEETLIYSTYRWWRNEPLPPLEMAEYQRIWWETIKSGGRIVIMQTRIHECDLYKAIEVVER